MIRFRTGQSWKREPTSAPVDSFGLELEGVDLLAGASAERLDLIVPELVTAVGALWSGDSALAQVSLPEVHWVLGLERDGSEVLLHVVSLSRPARRLRRPVRVEIGELVRATIACGRQLLTDATDDQLSPRRRRALAQGLEALARPPGDREEQARFEYRGGGASPGPGFGFQLADRTNLTGRLEGLEHGALTSLLSPGRVWLRGEAPAPLWSADAIVFPFALELARQAADLAHAIELRERSFSFEPGGVGQKLTVRIADEQLELGGVRHPFAPARLAREMYNLGLALLPVLREHNPVQAKNPYLIELQERCQEGLSRFPEVRPPATRRPARQQKAARKKDEPIAGTGRLRRLRFEPLWSKERLGGESPGRLLLGDNGPIFVSPEMVVSLATSGELRFRRVGTSGLAVARDEHVVTSDGRRILAFDGPAESARWLRDHDGLAFGPELSEADGMWLTTAQSRVVLCLDPVTGRELWRLAPFRSQKIHLSVQGHRALIATDAGHLFGVELADGQLRYRVNAPLPLIAPATAWGRRAVALLGRRDTTSLVVLDADSGGVEWTCQLELSRPSSPLARGRRVLIAGERHGEGVLLSLSSDGKVVWERPLPQERGPFFLVASGTSTIVAGSNGAATKLDASGNVEWRVGATGDERFDFPPVVARGVAVVPGDPIRAIDLHGGRVLGEIKAGPGVCDLAVDPNLNLYVLDDRGTLQAYHLRSYFSVVEGR